MEKGIGIVWCHWRMGHRDEEIVLKGRVELLVSSLGVFDGDDDGAWQTWRVV